MVHQLNSFSKSLGLGNLLLGEVRNLLPVLLVKQQKSSQRGSKPISNQWTKCDGACVTDKRTNSCMHTNVCVRILKLPT